MRYESPMKPVALVFILVALSISLASAGTVSGILTFSNTPLVRPEGDSEPAISIAADGTMAITGLQWLFDPNFFGTHLWTGPFGSTPTFRGLIDASLQKKGKQVFGSGDADVDLGSTGTLHATSLIFLINPVFNNAKLGVSAITCTDKTASNCTSQIIDTAGADRQWITSDGTHVYIAYHDSANSSLIHVQRSNDDGYTWRRVGDPIVGQGRITGNATFNNTAGPIVADPFTHNVYTIYTAGQPGIQKATTADFNNVYVSRSTDGGQTWTANLVYHAPLFTSLSNVFPAMAVDATNGKLYATWSDAHAIFFSGSSDQGAHWSAAVTVNIAPANTALFPWVAAYNGTVDTVYYATTAAGNDSTAVWNVYLAQTNNDGASFTQSLVSNTSNHVGVVCTNGTGCAEGTRNLLDLFEVAINPQNGLAAVIYTDDTITTTTSGDPLPQIVLAQQNP
ncbi:MAG: sialidase family protein [bacterium]